MGLLEHLEAALGEIHGGSAGDDSTPDGVQIAWFARDRPFTGVTTLATVGVSHHGLLQGSGTDIRMEFLMHLANPEVLPRAAGLLFQVAAEVLSSHTALARGSVIGPRGPMFDGTDKTALYVTGPVYMPDGFSVAATENGNVMMVMLVPITTAEADFVDDQGWPAFQRALATEDPDLTDVTRPSLVAVL